MKAARRDARANTLALLGLLALIACMKHTPCPQNLMLSRDDGRNIMVVVEKEVGGSTEGQDDADVSIFLSEWQPRIEPKLLLEDSQCSAMKGGISEFYIVVNKV